METINIIYLFCLIILCFCGLYCYFESFFEKYIYNNPRQIYPLHETKAPIALVVES